MNPELKSRMRKLVDAQSDFLRTKWIHDDIFWGWLKYGGNPSTPFNEERFANSASIGITEAYEIVNFAGQLVFTYTDRHWATPGPGKRIYIPDRNGNEIPMYM